MLLFLSKQLQVKENWPFIVKFLESLAGICINRCYLHDVEPRDYIVSHQLHGFSDASEKAYGCCISSSLVTLKSRVAPY